MSPVGAIAVIGEEALVRGFGLAGAVVLPAGDGDEARAAWRRLPDGTAVVILTAMAATAIGEDRPRAGGTPFVAVMR